MNLVPNLTIGAKYVVAALIVGVSSISVTPIMRRSNDHVAKLIAAADLLPTRAIEGRLAGGFAHRPFVPIDHRASDVVGPTMLPLYSFAANMRMLSAPDVQPLAAAQLLMGQYSAGVEALSTTTKNVSGKIDLSNAVYACADQALLTNLSAAELETYRQRRDPRALLMAVESSTEAVARKPTPEALWNRALAINGLGIRRQAIDAWKAYLDVEQDPLWAAEGRSHLAQWRRRNRVDLDALMHSFEESVIATAHDPTNRAELSVTAERVTALSSDPFAKDVAAAVIAGLEDARTERATKQGLLAYATGLRVAEDDRTEAAAYAFEEADRRLSAARNPLALAAAYQRMRAVCNEGSEACDAAIESLRSRLDEAPGRYAALTARAAVARGRRLLSRQHSLEALDAYQEALEVFERSHDMTNAAWTHTLIADVLVGSGETGPALSHHLRALSSEVQGGNRRRQQLEDAAFLLIRLDALDTASIVLEELRRMPGSVVATAAESALQAGVAVRRGQRDRAVESIVRAEKLLQGIPETATAWIRPYLEVVRVATLRDGESEVLLQRLDDRAANGDLLWQSEIAFQRGLIYQRRRRFREAEADFREAIRLIELRTPSLREMVMGAGLLASNASPFDALVTLLLDQDRHAEALRVAERSSALQVSTLYGKSERLANPYSKLDVSIQRAQTNSARTLLVKYVSLPHELVTFTVRGATVAVHRQTIERERLTNEVRHFATCIRDDCTDDALVGRLSRLLVEKAVDATTQDEPIVFIAPPEWDVVPFVALADSYGRPLLERHLLAVAESIEGFDRANAIDESRANGTGALFVAASNPSRRFVELPAAEEETASASLYCHRIVLKGREASRKNFLAAAPNAAIIDFAGHAIVDHQQPLRSTLVFSHAEEDASDLLYVHDITQDLFAQARLAVLAACETGIAPRPAMSIAASLRARGTPSVIYTLWGVEDATSAAFSVALHRRIAGGQPRVAAIAGALRELRQSARRDQWAAFQLSGALGSIMKGGKVCK